MRWHDALALSATLALWPALARPNGVRPPRMEWTFDVSCETAAGEQAVRNARATGLQRSKKLSEIRVKGDGAADVPVPFREVEFVTLGKIKGAYADAELKRRDQPEREKVKVRITGEAGAVRLSAFGSTGGSKAGVKLAACKRITVTQRVAEPDETPPEHEAVAK